MNDRTPDTDPWNKTRLGKPGMGPTATVRNMSTVKKLLE